MKLTVGILYVRWIMGSKCKQQGHLYGGQVKGGTVRADGRLYTGEYYNWKELPLLAHHVRLTAL